MKRSRSLLLIVSALLTVFLLGGGLVARVGAGESAYHQVVVFSEILSLIIDNYVDDVDSEALLLGAYEGMLGGLDANGAYLTPDEVESWKADPGELSAGPGISVLKAGRALQVVAVDPGSPAEDAGIEIGDHIRAVDDRVVRDMSLGQAWRLIQGPRGSEVTLEVLHPSEGFRREAIQVTRATRPASSFALDVERGIGVLRIRDMQNLSIADLTGELDDIRSRGVSELLLDLRNLADMTPRDVAAVAGLFANGPLFHLRDRSGRLVDTVESATGEPAWTGSVAVLVNGATAGSAEALASLMQAERGCLVLGEATYGLGSEVKLYEMEDGSGLLVSSALWETVSGSRWNDEGVQPDELIHGRGDDYAAMSDDQLSKTLDHLEERSQATAPAGEREAA